MHEKACAFKKWARIQIWMFFSVSNAMKSSTKVRRTHYFFLKLNSDQVFCRLSRKAPAKRRQEVTPSIEPSPHTVRSHLRPSWGPWARSRSFSLPKECKWAEQQEDAPQQATECSGHQEYADLEPKESERLMLVSTHFIHSRRYFASYRSQKSFGAAQSWHESATKSRTVTTPSVFACFSCICLDAKSRRVWKTNSNGRIARGRIFKCWELWSYGFLFIGRESESSYRRQLFGAFLLENTIFEVDEYWEGKEDTKNVKRWEIQKLLSVAIHLLGSQ